MNIKNFPIQQYISWITGILLVTWITQLIVIQIYGQTLQKKIHENAAIQKQNDDDQQALQLIMQYQTQIETISRSYLDENGIIQFVRQLENRMDEFQDTKLTINTNEPVQNQKLFAPFLPVTIAATATPEAYPKFMEYISQSHYLFQPVYLEITAPQGLNRLSKINYQGNLFVSQELIK